MSATWSLLSAFALQDLLPAVYLAAGLGILALGMVLWGAEDSSSGG
ncbi:MAG: hypothetical protein ABWY78_15095 [Microvirga sp.]